VRLQCFNDFIVCDCSLTHADSYVKGNFVNGRPYFTEKFNLVFSFKTKNFGKIITFNLLLILTLTPQLSPNPNRKSHIMYTRMNIAQCSFSLRNIFSGEIVTPILQCKSKCSFRNCELIALSIITQIVRVLLHFGRTRSLLNKILQVNWSRTIPSDYI